MEIHAPDRPPAATVTILAPTRGFARLNLKQLWAHRELVYFFVWRDLKVRYKQSVIGTAWVLIQPLSLMLVFTVFFGLLANIPSDGIPRPIFYFCGLVPWTFFSQSVIRATNSVVENRSIITKVYFPRLVFPISSSISFVLDMLIGVVLLAGMTLMWGFNPRVTWAYVPGFLVLAILTALVAGTWFSALNARYRDVHYAVGFLVYVLMFASPVVYPSSIVPSRWRDYYALNPMAAVIDGMRWSITGSGQAPSWSTVISAFAVLTLGVGGLFYFRRNESTIVDVV